LVIDSVLDEEGDPGSVELTPIKRAVAIHFGLKDKVDSPEVLYQCFEFHRFDELLSGDFYDVYADLNAAIDVIGEDGTNNESVAKALAAEVLRAPVDPDISDDPQLADLQRTMGISKSMAENYKKIANKVQKNRKR